MQADDLDDVFIDNAIMDGRSFTLLHMKEPYDPEKRRAYYLKTRKLKGRKSASVKPVTGIKKGSAPKVSGGKKGDLEARRAASLKRREAQKVKIARLEAKLEHLNAVLQELVDAAKKRSGVEDNDKTRTKKSTTAKTADKMTTKEKRDAAERAADRREKENNYTPSQELAQLQQKIAGVQKKIAAAIERARQEKASKSKQKVTANKGR